MDTPRLYGFQKQAINDLDHGKHFAILGTGSGKTAISLNWAEHKQAETGKKKMLVVTTPSKRDSGDWTSEMQFFTPSLEKKLDELEIISWHGLDKWTRQHIGHLGEYIYIFDEAKCQAGVSSGMGRAFLKIARHTKDWTLYTATPGDTWIKFYPYFQATELTRNKTHFIHDYCIVQTYKGFPEIVQYVNQDELKDMWASISTAPDTSQMARELPPEMHKVVKFEKPKGYSKVLKEQVSLDGTMLDTAGALTAELRRMCFTKAKRQWVSDFVEGLGTNAVMFYNFIKTGDELEEIIKKALPKGAKIWRIDGKRHEIPTPDTIGKYDIVLCQWQSGSEALNLQFMHYWVGVEMTYSYSTALQARGRIKRIGQKASNMWFYYLKTEHTIEDAVYKALKNKSDFASDVWLIQQNISFNN